MLAVIGTSLVVQWLQLGHPVQRVPVRTLVGELRWPKNQNIKNGSNVVTNSIETFKNTGHHKDSSCQLLLFCCGCKLLPNLIFYLPNTCSDALLLFLLLLTKQGDGHCPLKLLMAKSH